MGVFVSSIVVANSEQDARAVDAVKEHHAQLAGALGRHSERLLNTAISGDLASAQKAKQALLEWCETELLPHALAEEARLYPKAQEDASARLLIDAMIGEHRDIVAMIAQVRDASNSVLVAAHARALGALFDSHLAKENEQILPLLASAHDVSLTEILGGMHELLGSDGEEGGCAGECTCGHQESSELPELDARTLPHAIRHATIFGALDCVSEGMILLAPHDPLPLLAQLETRAPGRFSIEYLERGPEVWRLQFVRN